MNTKRGFVTTLVDRFATRRLGFPPETCSYTVTGVRIPVLDDGSKQLELAADLYNLPYGRGLAIALLSARPYAARGYQCLLVSCRGTFGSGGEFDPWRNEEEDGHAVVEWMRNQDWYTGSFATLGGSYLGFVQWALLRNPPSDMVAAVIQCAPHGFSQQLWGTGSLALEWITWGENVAHQEETGVFQILKALNTPKRMRPALDRVPLAEGVKSHFKGRAPWLDFVRAEIPIFLRNANVALLMGPWNHMRVGQVSRVYRQSFDWLEEHLAKRMQGTRKTSVQYFVTGTKEWRDVQNWPPLTHARELYLRSGGRLARGGSADDTGLAARCDALAFTTEVTVELSHSSDNPHADLFVRISEVDANTETYKRLDPGREGGPVILYLNDCAHRFVKGNRIRLIIAGASHPQFAINTGQGIGGTSDILMIIGADKGFKARRGYTIRS
ncbi:X-Pro dipeptidyl-peptidase-domain-containing protein [Aspergillus cavernicola]|uniref:X-Pro dipeptidyl-peptidase-domain-containing protein n=1 Tax=Aspergillus cavernicola TaxID=176166 RepID=A0ABR4HYU8_9EURO